MEIQTTDFPFNSPSGKGLGSYQSDTAIADTDALYTYEPNLLLCSFTVDCVPVIFYNEVN